ncbi:Glycosyltransferase [Anaerovibrio sp. JC8]|nr:Glycosyltransferase [Anaerovibrio sp. JC8]
MQDIHNFFDHLRGYDICRNVNKTSYGKDALLCYITKPFFSQKVHYRHQNQWQAVAITKVLGEFGYNVDVIDYNRSTPTLKHNYDLVIDMAPGWYGSKVYNGFMNQGCKRIFYVTGSYPAWAEEQSKARREAVFKRRGVRFMDHREFRPIPDYITDFDGVFMFGNEYNWATYTASFNMPPVNFIANSGYKFPYAINNNKRSANKFLYFASGDQIHKGLDLLLEVFAQPGFPCELFICSSFKSEKLFCKTYYKELYETPNIHAIGFVNIMGDEFKEILESCQYVIVPSCSEGQMGSALTAMSAGLIPILSRVCGFGEDVAILLPDCELSTIESVVREYANKDVDWCMKESDRLVKLVENRYSNENFVRSIVEGLIKVTGEEIEICADRIREISEG